MLLCRALYFLALGLEGALEYSRLACMIATWGQSPYTQLLPLTHPIQHLLHSYDNYINAFVMHTHMQTQAKNKAHMHPQTQMRAEVSMHQNTQTETLKQSSRLYLYKQRFAGALQPTCFSVSVALFFSLSFFFIVVLNNSCLTPVDLFLLASLHSPLSRS